MKLWKAWTWHNSEGCEVSWHATKTAAEIANAEKQARDDYTGPSNVEATEIEVSKAGILEWLNRNFTRENG